MTLTRTFTRTHNAITFSDPYKQCVRCQGWIDGALDCDGPLTVIPCEHQAGYDDLCPSWGPVDGCTCDEAGIVHEKRTPVEGDGHIY